MNYFFPVTSAVGIIILFWVIRNDKDEDGEMTKQGWKKFGITLGILFVAQILILGIFDMV